MASCTGPASDRSPQLRSAGPRRAGRLLRRTGIALGLTAALATGWLVLVTLRMRGVGTGSGDDLAAVADEVVAGTLLADRVQSVVQWITNVATTFLVGGVIFRSLVAGPHLPDPLGHREGPGGDRCRGGMVRALRVAGLVALAGTLLVIVPRAAAVAGGPAALDVEAIRLVAVSRFGDAACLRLAGLALLLGLALPDHPGRPGWLSHTGAAAGVALVLAGFAVGGHARVSEPAHLLVMVQAVHIVAVSTWFGGVACLALELRHIRGHGTPAAAATVVARFSRVAAATVVLAAVSGGMLAASQLVSPAALVSTAYGRALAGKLAVLAVPLAIGGYNERRLVPAITRRRDPEAWRRLQVTAATEAVLLAGGVLLLTAAMTSGGF